MPNSKHKWIETGYDLCAREGPQRIPVERLARMLNRNKSGFYHYFKGPENFLHELLKYHHEETSRMAIDIQNCKTFDPDFLRIAVKHKRCVLAQVHFERKEFSTSYSTAVIQVREMIDFHLLPLWRDSFHLPQNRELVLKHFNLFRNAILAHVNLDTFTYDFLHTTLEESRVMMREVFRFQRSDGKAKRRERKWVHNQSQTTT